MRGDQDLAITIGFSAGKRISIGISDESIPLSGFHSDFEVTNSSLFRAHRASDGKLGPLIDDSGRFYKPLQVVELGSREVAFYRDFSTNAEIPDYIRKFFPVFYGTEMLEGSNGSGLCSVRAGPRCLSSDVRCTAVMMNALVSKYILISRSQNNCLEIRIKSRISCSVQSPGPEVTAWRYTSDPGYLGILIGIPRGFLIGTYKYPQGPRHKVDPKYGCGPKKDFRFGAVTCSHLVLQDFVSGRCNPSVVDIKIGSRTWYPEASEDCNEKCLKKDRNSTSVSSGFRMSGLRVFESKEPGFWKLGKKQVSNFTSRMLD
ncbi:hypothetical protein SLEP1_g28943 [Rubroshorea leprosula]|uniref:Inositol polyphosphate multikinase n=1 Tax=Rubroshorea leprosula TaxID=152421 RepID=A0AAV5K1E4_9ROSI|nr:hypothetical protein SLEP1_g28943 [Rubroshorea leprosula]